MSLNPKPVLLLKTQSTESAHRVLGKLRACLRVSWEGFCCQIDKVSRRPVVAERQLSWVAFLPASARVHRHHQTLRPADVRISTGRYLKLL